MLVLIVLFMERKLYLIELAIAQVCFDQRSVLRYCDIVDAGQPGEKKKKKKHPAPQKKKK